MWVPVTQQAVLMTGSSSQYTAGSRHGLIVVLVVVVVVVVATLALL